MSDGSGVPTDTQGAAGVASNRQTYPSWMNFGQNRGDFAFLPVPTGGLGGGWVGNYRARDNKSKRLFQSRRTASGSHGRARHYGPHGRGEPS